MQMIVESKTLLIFLIKISELKHRMDTDGTDTVLTLTEKKKEEGYGLFKVVSMEGTISSYKKAKV